MHSMMVKFGGLENEKNKTKIRLFYQFFTNANVGVDVRINIHFNDNEFNY